ncbi:BamA/OMP85 family outer membrane protein [Desulfotignum balticum]|uniref:BamA/OMP85 family outer membrane protein n=1 Tax=Desulfotignum balticum TaxID=115781 RepID=UPI000462D711|nr:POTRA domain-containing protein [Desulfotignum balticum]
MTVSRVMLCLWLIPAMTGWIVSVHAETTRPVIEKIDVDIQGGTRERQAKLLSMAVGMIQLQPGDRLDAGALNTTLSLLKQSGQFSAIHVPDPDLDAKSISLIFQLTPVVQVKRIKVTGAFPVFSQSIVRATDYRIGGPFFEDQVKKNIRAMESVMKEKGYVDAQVHIRTETAGNLEKNVFIDVEKNVPLRTVDIEIHGNRTFSDTRLKMRMKSYQLPLFFWSKGSKTVSSEVAADVKELLSFYRKKGFVDATVTSDLHTDLEQKISRLTIHIEEGPKYRVSFSGNREFSDRTLKKDLTLWSKGNRNDFGLKRSIKAIRERYEKAGYRDCEVDFTAKSGTQGQKPVRDIEILLHENTRYLVDTTLIKGVNALDEKSLSSHLNTRGKSLFYDGPLVENMPESDRQTLENIYKSQGFENTRVTADVTWKEQEDKNQNVADVVFDVTEGYRKQVTKVVFEGIPKGIDPAVFHQTIKTRENEFFLPSRVDEDRIEILTLLGEHGYIYSEVTPRVVSDGKDCKVVFQVTPDQMATVGGVWVFGNFDTKEDVILRHNTLEQGDPVSLDGFLTLQNDVRDLQCLDRVNFKAIGVQEKLDQVFFTAEVEEKNPYFLETSIGYDTSKDAYLAVSAGDRNWLGTNRRLYLNAEVSGIGYDAVLGVTDYDFLARRVYSDANIYMSEEELKNQNFGTRKYGSSLMFEKPVTQHLTLGTRFGLESREQYPTGNNTGTDPEIYAARGILSATPFVTWSSVDSYARPTRGFYFNASAGYTRDMFEDLDNFMKYQANAKYYYQPFSRLVLAFQAMYGTLQNFSSDALLPDDQLFFLGGISDVRGVGENELVVDAFGDPVGGKTQIAGSIEARIDLGGNLELPIFVDAGTLQDTPRAGRNEGVKYTIGSGLRYMTPVGPVGLLYGYRLNPETGEDSGRLHFSIGYTF